MHQEVTFHLGGCTIKVLCGRYSRRGGGSKVYLMSVGSALLKQPGVLKTSSSGVCLGKSLFMRN